MISKEIATVIFDKQFLNIYLFLHNYFKVASIFFLDKKKIYSYTNIKIILSIQSQYNYSFDNKIFKKSSAKSSNLENHTKKENIYLHFFQY